MKLIPGYVKIENETLLFRVKIVGRNEKFYRQIVSKGRENRTVEIAFWIIPISRSVAEIYGFEVSIAVNIARKL